MATPSERLQAARKRAGFDSASGAAEAMGIPVSTYIQHENGTRGEGGVPKKAAMRYAKRFRVSLDWLMTGRGDGPAYIPDPSEDDLAAMLETALRELPVGVTYGDLPRYVAPSLNEQLRRFRADREAAANVGAPIAPDTDARSLDATKRGAEA